MKLDLILILTVALCALGFFGSASAQNLLLNPGFEDWDDNGPAGPPDDWLESSDSLDGFQTSIPYHSGFYCCGLNSITTSTVALEQFVAVTEGHFYELSAWFFDNNPYSRGRLVFRYFDSGGGFLAGSYGLYTSDDASWQSLSCPAIYAPPGAVTAHVELRSYAVDWGDSITNSIIYVDDAVFGILGGIEPDTLAIWEIQFNNSTQGGGSDCYPSSYDGEYVLTSGIVTAVTSKDSFWMQDAEAQWSGLYVEDDTVNPSRGDSVTITATVDEYEGSTQLIDVSDFLINSSGNPEPVPLDITTAEIAADSGCFVGGEYYEGVLVRINNVTCTQDLLLWSNEWYVDDGTGECQIDDNMYFYDPTVGEEFEYIIGIVHYANGEYEINPRDADDVAFPSPEAIEDLAANLAGENLAFGWSAVTVDTAGNSIPVDLYLVYRDTVSFFGPGSEPFDSTAVTFYMDTSGVVGDIGTHYFYAVTAVFMGKESEPSIVVGEFDRHLDTGP